ncbi:unnamed protein product [Dicrocoelium dendriticum]|nr:unnamed protein product [Dicrocoelium dendriticum]
MLRIEGQERRVGVRTLSLLVPIPRSRVVHSRNPPLGVINESPPGLHLIEVCVASASDLGAMEAEPVGKARTNRVRFYR